MPHVINGHSQKGCDIVPTRRQQRHFLFSQHSVLPPDGAKENILTFNTALAWAQKNKFSKCTKVPLFHPSLPVGLPDMDGLIVHVVVLERLLVQEVKKVFDRRRHHRPGAQHTAEEIVHKLLQRSLEETTTPSESGKRWQHRNADGKTSAFHVCRRETIWSCQSNKSIVKANIKCDEK